MKNFLRFKFSKTYRKYGLLGLILLFLAISSISIGAIIIYNFFSSISNSVRIIQEGENIDPNLTGMIGDFVGGVIGTIWSFSGVILFFLALRLQSKELSLQIKELKDTREVFSIQQFENTFFNLLKTQNDIRENIEYRIEDYNSMKHEKETTVFNSTSVFEEIKQFMWKEKEKLDRNMQAMEYGHTEESKWDNEKLEDNLKDFKEYYTVSYEKLAENPSLKSKAVFKITFKKFHNQLSHYFRNLYHILLYVKENEEKESSFRAFKEYRGEELGITINDKNIFQDRINHKFQKYSKFIQAQMSGPELLLLFYNALFYKRMKRLVQYYDIVSNLNLDDLLYPDIDQNNYRAYTYELEFISESKLKSRDQDLEI